VASVLPDERSLTKFCTGHGYAIACPKGLEQNAMPVKTAVGLLRRNYEI